MALLKQNILILISLIILMGITASCASTGNTHDSSRQDRSVIEVKDTNFTLADYLGKFSGVNVQGSGNNVWVRIRGATSFRGDTRPLYVVDGQRMGQNYSYVANQVHVTDIKSIKVLKGAEASIYGVQGGNGVIEITTKSN